MPHDNHFKDDWLDLFYADPDPACQRVREFARWLRKNRNTEITLFHGTAAKLPILEQGLLPTSAVRRRRSYQSGSGYVYLSIFPSSAKMFGEMGYPGQRVVIYAVKVKIKELRPDKDQLRNMRYFAQKQGLFDTLEHSLIFGHGARVKGKIDSFCLSTRGDQS